MARRWTSPLTAALAALTLAACADSATTAPPPVDVRRGAFDLTTAAACGVTTTVDLELMSPSGVVGTVAAWNDATDLHVEFMVDRATEYGLRESFLWAGSDAAAIPLNPSGAPRVGAFPYHAGHKPMVSHYEYVVPLSAVGGTVGQDLAIAAMAILGRGPARGTSWGDGAPINPPAPHEYFVHQVQRCGSPPPPPPGKDIVVFNDINVFDNGAHANPNNAVLIQNLVNYTTSGPRGANTVIVWDRGRSATCGAAAGNSECEDANMSITQGTITGAGYTLLDVRWATTWTT